MEFNWVLILFGALWLLGKVFEKAKRKPAALGATQREGNRLELMLRELQRSLEQGGTVGSRTTVRLPPAEEIEEHESLEVDADVRSLEGEVHRASRQRVDRDEGAEQIEAGRIAAAAARDVASSKSEPAGLDPRIRQQPADHTATRGYTPQQLREAMVWREILGPPVSLREGER
jgi:hypothetical protein